jgi:hypothetical protein
MTDLEKRRYWDGLWLGLGIGIAIGSCLVLAGVAFHG